MSSKNSHDANDATLNELGDFLREQEDIMAAEVDRDPFGPLTDDEQNTLTDAVLARLGRVETEPAKSVPLAPVVRLTPRRSKWPMVAGALSVAAAAMFVFWPRAEESSLPAYALVLPSVDASHRDADAPSDPTAGQLRSYVLGRELEVLLRPATRVALGVEARAFAEADAGKLEQIRIEPTSMPGGAVIFRVPTGQGTRFEKPVTTRLHFVITSSGTTPSDLSSLADIPSEAQHLVFPFRLVAEHTLDR